MDGAGNGMEVDFWLVVGKAEIYFVSEGYVLGFERLALSRDY